VIDIFKDIDAADEEVQAASAPVTSELRKVSF
jgi:hypothetical protein